MSFKLTLICALVILVGDVKCDCDDYLKCLGDFIHNFFGYKENNSTVTDINNNTNEYGEVQNISINIFEITDLQKSLNIILSEVTSLIKDEIDGKLKIESESDILRTVDNATEILIKTFDLGDDLSDLDDNDDIFTYNDTERIKGLIDFVDDVESLDYSDEFFEDWLVNKPDIDKSTNNIETSTLIPTTDTNYEIENIYNKSEQFNTNYISTSRFDLDFTTDNTIQNKEHDKELYLNPNDKLKDNDTLLQVSNEEKEKVELPKVIQIRNSVDDNVEESLIAIESKDQLKTNNNNRTQSFYSNFVPLSILQYEEPTDVSNKTKKIINNKSVVNISNIGKENIDFSENKQEIMKEKSKIVTTTDNRKENVTTFRVIIPEFITNDTEIIQDVIDFNPTILNNITNTVVSSNITHTYDIKISNNTKGNKKSENTSDTEIMIPDQDFEEYYNDIQDDNATDYPIIDYIELYKDTTNENVEYNPTETATIEANGNSAKVSDLDNAIEYSLISEEGLRSGRDNASYTEPNAAEVNAWIASVYVKNGTSNQFDYYCDGALLARNLILTAARCVTSSNATLDAGNLIIIVGKRSLQTTEDGERVHRVKKINIHANFTSSGEATESDLAFLVLEEPVTYSSSIQAASLRSGEVGEYGESFTTGWAFSGNLTAVHFDTDKSRNCKKHSVSVNTFCATYGNDVTTCPSYGGLYITKLTDQWTLQGIRTGDPADRSFCVDKTVLYTSLISYIGWINENIDSNKGF